MTKIEKKYQNRKYTINDAIYVISNIYCFSLDVYISLFHWVNHFCKKKNKERNKQNESSKFKIQFFLKFLALKFCSTSPPGGNQVDGLPPVPHTGAAYIALNSVSRFFVTFDIFFLCRVQFQSSFQNVLHSKWALYM